MIIVFNMFNMFIMIPLPTFEPSVYFENGARKSQRASGAQMSGAKSGPLPAKGRICGAIIIMMGFGPQAGAALPWRRIADRP